MSDVPTTATPLACPHNFPVTVSANATLTIGGVSVFGPSDLTAGAVACTAGQSKCASIASAGPGTTALTVDGNPVIIPPIGATNIGPISEGPAPPPPSALTAI
jgi:hypothetical protein